MNKFIGQLNTSRLLVCATTVHEALEIATNVLTENNINDPFILLGNCEKQDVVKTYVRYFNETIESKHEFIVITATGKYKKTTSSLATILKV